MSVRWLRLGFFSFFILSAAFAVNLLMFQPWDGRQPLARTPTAKLALARNEASSDIATGSLTILNAQGSATRSPAAAGPGPQRTRPQAVGAEPDTVQPGGSDAPEIVRAVQRELHARGYETGAADGMPGLVTRAAIMAYEADHGLPLTATATQDLLQKILLGAPGEAPAKGRPPGAEAEQVIRTVQQSLVSLGYRPGAVDGRLGAGTLRTIREFEKDQALPETGRISGQLVARLARLAGQGRIADGR